MPWIFCIPEMWMDIVSFPRTVISPVWRQGFGNPECWSWVWGRRRRPSRLFPHATSLNIWISSTATSRRKRRRKIWLLQQKLKNPETTANRAAPAPGRTKISSGYARPSMPSSRNFLTKRDGFPPDSWATSLGNDFRILMCVITDIPS